MKDDSQPLLRKIGRRRLLKLAALGGGAIAATAAAVAVWPRETRVGLDAVPVQNPAFRAAVRPPDGGHILYCQTGDGSFLAYELNRTAFAIWNACNGYADFMRGDRRTVASAASALASRTDPKTVMRFVGELQSRGLVFLSDGRNRVYFPYQQVS